MVVTINPIFRESLLIRLVLIWIANIQLAPAT
jgi:hypothetical protein